MSKIGIFSPRVVQKMQEENSTASKLREIDLKDDYPGSEKSWRFAPIGTGFQSTQQMEVDWTDFSKHTFFHSAEAKVNAAYERIINHFPFDGTAQEVRDFLDGLTGYEKYIYDNFPKYSGYFKFVSEDSTSINIKDSEGYLFPTLSKNARLQSVIGTGVNDSGYTFECYFNPPDDGESNGKQVLFQKLDTSGYNGITVGVEASSNSDKEVKIYSIISSGSSGNLKSLFVTGSIAKGKFSHISTIFDKGKSDSLHFLVDGNLVSTSNNSQQFSNLDFVGSDINIGNGSRHYYSSTSFLKTQTLTGSIDDLKFWTYAKTFPEVSSSIKKGGFAEPGLSLFLKFNEPTGSYDNSAIVLDSSGNGLHGVVQNYASSNRVIEISHPVTYENVDYNPVLFPDYPVIVAKNTLLLNSASHYDRVNPNTITKLVPSHFIERDPIQDIDPAIIGPYTSSISAFPGGGKMPPNQIIASFLYMWATFFDDLKMYVDSFSKIKDLNYKDLESIPSEAIMMVAKQYGFDLPNVFEDATPQQFHLGKDLKDGQPWSQVTLKQILHSVWRRFLTEIPHISRSKGTISSIKMLLNTFGINPDTNFRIREYGGQSDISVKDYRKEKRIQFPMINFTSPSMFLSSSHYNAYRWAGGEPYGGPIPEFIHIDIGDIDMWTINNPPSRRTLTSGSWAYEGHYIMPKTAMLATQSLARLNISSSYDTGNNLHGKPSPVMNFLAYSGSEDAPYEYRLRVALAGTSSEAARAIATLENVNIFDGSKWYLNVSNHYYEEKAKLEITAIQSSGQRVYQKYTTSSYYLTHPTDVVINGNVIESKKNIGLLKSPDVTSKDHDSGYPYGPNLAIGKETYSDAKFLNNASNTAAYTATEFLGKVGGMRLWSKALSDKEKTEHALNVNSVGADDPFVNNVFAHSQYPTIGSMAIADLTSSMPIILPKGSWQRLRAQYDLYTDITSSNTHGFLEIEDNSRGGYNLNLSGFPATSSVIHFEGINNAILESNWDAPNASNKIRVRSFLDEENAGLYDAVHGKFTELDPQAPVSDDRRFAMEASVSQALNDDIVNLFSGLGFLNDAVGAPENLFAVNYPTLDRIADKYFVRLSDKVVFKHLFEFFKWFDNNFSVMIERLLPRTTEFLGVNFVIESHMLERHKLQYQQADVHIDLNDRLAARLDPLFIGWIRREIV